MSGSSDARWFRVPVVETVDPVGGGTEQWPKHREAVESWSGDVLPGGQDYLVHMYGTTAELDAVAADPAVTELTDTAAEQLAANLFGHTVTIDELNRRFRRGPPPNDRPPES